MKTKGRILKRKSHQVATKTVNNIVKGRHPSEIGKLSAIAETFGIPLWVMFVPDLPKELLQKPQNDRLTLLIKNYIACTDTDRVHAENIAAAYAGKKKDHEKREAAEVAQEAQS
jgi:hypothetical protein